MYNKINPVIWFLILVSACARFDRNTQERFYQQASSIEDEAKTLATQDINQCLDYLQSCSNHENSEIIRFVDLLQIKYDTTLTLGQKIASYSEITISDDFSKLDPFFQFKTHFQYAELMDESGLYIEAIAHLSKACEKIDRNSLYNLDLADAYTKLGYMSFHSLGEGAKSQKSYEFAFQLYDKLDRKDQAAKALFAIAIHLIHQQKFEAALKHFELSEEYMRAQEIVPITKIVGDIYSSKVWCYTGLKKTDKVHEIIDKVQSMYLSGEIDHETMVTFDVEILKPLIELGLIEKVQKMIVTLKKEVANKCSNRYRLSKIFEALQSIAQLQHDLEAEKRHSHKLLQYSLHCGKANQYFKGVATNTLERLIAIEESDSLDSPSITHLYRQLNELESEWVQVEKAYVAQADYWAQKNERSASHSMKKQKYILWLISSLAAILVLLLLKISQLYRKGKNHENELLKTRQLLQKSNTQLSIDNKELQELNLKLLRQSGLISLQNKKLSNLNTALQESNSNLTHFAHRAAHDLKSPLITINSLVQKLYEDGAIEYNENNAQIVKYIEQNSSELRNIIDGLLEYSGVANNHRQRPINSRKLIKKVLNLLKDSIDKSQAIIEVENDLPNICGFETLIDQLFLNLISNAIKYQKKGNVPRIKISAKKTNRRFVRFQISDNGIGIQKENTHEVFELFKKLHAKSEYSGCGIGLATCRRIVERHGGDIGVISEPNIGSTFHFTLLRHCDDVASIQEGNVPDTVAISQENMSTT